MSGIANLRKILQLEDGVSVNNIVEIRHSMGKVIAFQFANYFIMPAEQGKLGFLAIVILLDAQLGHSGAVLPNDVVVWVEQLELTVQDAEGKLEARGVVVVAGFVAGFIVAECLMILDAHDIALRDGDGVGDAFERRSGGGRVKRWLDGVQRILIGRRDPYSRRAGRGGIWVGQRAAFDSNFCGVGGFGFVFAKAASGTFSDRTGKMQQTDEGCSYDDNPHGCLVEMSNVSVVKGLELGFVFQTPIESIEASQFLGRLFYKL